MESSPENLKNPSSDGKHHRRKSFSAADLGDTTAETQLLTSMEERRGRVRAASGEAYRTAVQGERPVLGNRNVSFEEMYNVYGGDDSERTATSYNTAAAGAARRLREIARRVLQKRQVDLEKEKSSKHKRSSTVQAHILLQSITEAGEQQETDAETPTASRQATAENNDSNTGFFENVGGDEPELGTSAFAVESSQMDRLVRGALKVERLLEADDDDSTGSSSSLYDANSAEELPLLSGDGLTHHRSARFKLKKLRKLAHKIACCCNPLRLVRLIWRMIRSAYFVGLALPLFIAAWICYYYLGNPHFDCMPGPATLSWWFNFVGRQLLTLELARLAQFILIDGLVLGSKQTVHWLGPLVTLWALQAKGWPLLAIAWGVWDLLLLHGDNAFQTHWLYWTDIAIYSQANSGSYILSSGLYLRALFSIIFIGLSTSFKRAFVAVYFGRRTFAVYKPRLKKILKDIVLVNEVADLAEEGDHIASTGEAPDEPSDRRGGGSALVKVAGSIKWSSDETFGKENGVWNVHDDEASSVYESDRSAASPFASPFTADRKDRMQRSQSLSRNLSGTIRIKNLLDRWEEPTNKLEKTTDASIHDILRFRRALAFMDEPCPFGETFGPASTRDECIESAHQVYARLLNLTTDSPVLPNGVLIMLATEEDGTINKTKRIALRKLFRPDRYDQLPLLAFVQSCDTLYRRLRYFRASVGNASVIDHVLEKMIDLAFWFFLFLLILSMMNINPWPLLVSLSTLLVSFSFAMGSSASKYIEGVLLIAARRPYDLGDRIIITGAETVDNPGSGSSWFVEDINLFSTTLRFGLTNEVATVNNGTIAGSRICNLNRSPNAVCVLELVMHICLIHNDQAIVFRTALEKYISDHPRVWEALVNFRYNTFDADNEQVRVLLQARHRNSWQDAARVLRDFGEFKRFVHMLGDTMGVNFDAPPSRRLIYQGGTLKTGAVEDFKRNLLLPENIENYINDDSLPPPPPPPTVDKDVIDTLFLAQLQKANAP
jgi:small-conductance mechanosensitive channel